MHSLTKGTKRLINDKRIMKTKIINIIGMLLVVCGFVACDKDRAGSMDVSGSCRVEKFVLNDKYEGAIDIPNKQIKVKVPVDFNTKNDMVVTRPKPKATSTSEII